MKSPLAAGFIRTGNSAGSLRLGGDQELLDLGLVALGGGLHRHLAVEGSVGATAGQGLGSEDEVLDLEAVVRQLHHERLEDLGAASDAVVVEDLVVSDAGDLDADIAVVVAVVLRVELDVVRADRRVLDEERGRDELPAGDAQLEHLEGVRGTAELLADRGKNNGHGIASFCRRFTRFFVSVLVSELYIL